jgi:hypothetical protein
MRDNNTSKDKELIVKGKGGRPSRLTPEVQARVIELTEEWFFARVVCAKADIDTGVLRDFERANPKFALALTHAKDKWIATQLDLLQTYAHDKKTSDWRAIEYLLSIADSEFSQRKYLTEAVANQDAKILMLIKAEQLFVAQAEGEKMLKAQQTKGVEDISLLPFVPESKSHKGKAQVKSDKKGMKIKKTGMTTPETVPENG